MTAFLRLMLLLPLLALPARAALPVALVTDLAGDTHSAGAPVDLLAELEADQTLSLADGARITLAWLDSGREYAFTGPAEIRITPAGPETVSGTPPQVHDLAGAGTQGVSIRPQDVAQLGVTMRAATEGDGTITLKAPVGTLLLTDQPEFHWEGPDTRPLYRFRLFDSGRQLLFETVTARTQLTVPAVIPLPTGEDLSWEIKLTSDDGARARGSFAIAAADILDQVNRLRPPPGAPFSQRVVFAAQLDNLGLHAAARDHWAELAEERPTARRLRLMASR